MSDLRVIPSIEQLRQRAAMRALETRYGRGALIDALRAETGALRDRLASGHVAAVTVDDAIDEIEIGAEARLFVVGCHKIEGRSVTNRRRIVSHV